MNLSKNYLRLIDRVTRLQNLDSYGRLSLQLNNILKKLRRIIVGQILNTLGAHYFAIERCHSPRYQLYIRTATSLHIRTANSFHHPTSIGTGCPGPNGVGLGSRSSTYCPPRWPWV